MEIHLIGWSRRHSEGIAQMEIHLIGWSRRHSEGLNIPKVLDFYSHERFYSSPFLVLVRAGKSGSTERYYDAQKGQRDRGDRMSF